MKSWIALTVLLSEMALVSNKGADTSVASQIELKGNLTVYNVFLETID